MTFRITALPLEPFTPLFAMDDDALARRRARRVVADAQPGYPCRVSLQDAAPGERLILMHHEHQSADTPFRASHAIYVRECAVRAEPAAGTIPAQFLHRTLSLRGFDAGGMMVAADLSPGDRLKDAIAAMLAKADVDHVHLHYAAAGCYAARVDRLAGPHPQG